MCARYYLESRRAFKLDSKPANTSSPVLPQNSPPRQANGQNMKFNMFTNNQDSQFFMNFPQQQKMLNNINNNGLIFQTALPRIPQQPSTITASTTTTNPLPSTTIAPARKSVVENIKFNFGNKEQQPQQIRFLENSPMMPFFSPAPQKTDNHVLNYQNGVESQVSSVQQSGYGQFQQKISEPKTETSFQSRIEPEFKPRSEQQVRPKLPTQYPSSNHFRNQYSNSWAQAAQPFSYGK